MKKRILAFALAMSMAFSLAMPAAAEAIELDDSTSVDTELLLDQLEKELQELPTERENDSSSEEVAEDPPATQEPDVLPEEPVPENTPVPTDDEQEGIPAEDEQPEATADPVETPEPTLLPESTAVPEVTEQPETATPETALDEYNADDDIALYIEHSDDQEYMRYLADYYLSNFPYDFYIKGGLKLPYRSDVESKKDNKSWNNTVTAWKVSTLGEGTAALDYTPQKIGYYDTVIFDVIYSVTNEKDFSSKMEKICKATQSGTLKKISKFAWKCKLIDTKTILSDMTDEQMDEFNRFMKDSKSFTNLCEKVGDVTKFFKYCSKVEDFVNKCARAEAILGQMSDTAVVLRQMATETTDMGLKQSLQNMADMCDGTWSEEDIQTFFGGQNATDLLIKEAYSVLWKAVAKECGSLGLAVQVGQAVGKTASNLLFSTDAILENYYSELALYEIEDVLRTVTERNRQAYQNNNSYENARNLNVSVDLMMRLHKQGISQSKEFAKAACEKGLVNKVKLFFNNKQYESYKSSLNNIESQIDFMIHFYDTDVYDLYIEDCGEEIQTDTGNVPEELPCKKEEEPVKRQELKLEADLVSGKTVSSDWTLDKDEEVYADLEITDGAIDLNGHTLTVCGNVIQTGGKLRINGGRLEVGGDYRIQTKGTNDFGDTVWNGSNGILVMSKPEDYVLVGGTFATSGKISTLTAGTLEVKGDFEQHGTAYYGDPYSKQNFDASGTHKVILTSEEEPRVYFESGDSKFQNLEIRNTNTINCDGSFLWVDGSLTAKDKKLEINSDVKLKTMDLAGQSLTVQGDLNKEDGTLLLNGGTVTVKKDANLNSETTSLDNGLMKVEGSVIQAGGQLRINGGRMEVGGDYRIQTKGTNDFGDTVWNGSNGILVMSKPEDYVLVGGTFATSGKISTLTAGTLEVKGDFEQHGTAYYGDPYSKQNFDASGTHKVILTSEEEPRVYFESGDSKFQNLEIRNTNTINCDGSFLWVDGSLTAKDKKLEINSDVKLKTMDLAGQSLTVQGDLNKEDGTLLLNGGTVTVKKDANLNSETTSLDNGLMKVEGSVIQAGGQLRINGGRMEVGGDYRIQTKGTNDFGDTVWNGSNGILVMSKPEDYVLVGGTFATSGKISTLTAGTLEVKGDFEQHGTAYYGDPYSKQNFDASGTHKVILSGEKPQTVSFDSSDSGFANLEVTNKEPLYLKGVLNIDSLQSDVTAKADGIKLYNVDLQGHTMNLTGDIYQTTGELKLQPKGVLNITGNLYQDNGTITMNQSTIKVSGNYRIQVKEKNSLGETVWNGSNGILVMSKPEDYVLVGGTFATSGKISTLTAGTLEVKGDFEQHGTAYYGDPYSKQNFDASGTHKVILSGEKPQTVSFDSSDSGFANLEVTNKEPLYLKGVLNIGSSTGSLQSDVTAKADGIKLYDIDLQGHAMSLTGNVYQKGGNIKLRENGILNITGNFYQEDGTLTMNKSTVQVTGDYRIQISGKNELDETVWNTGYGSIIMTKAEDHIIVGGTFATSGNESKLTAGTMEIAGDFEQHSNRTDRSFSASGTHKVILNGEGKQNISFDSQNSKFNILELTQARKNYTFEPDECWNTLIEDPVPGPETSPCGTNAKWSLEDGVLTISGRGAIDDYGKAASQPWYASRALITSIVVEEGVTAIGNFNFYGLTNLENVTLAHSVTDIGDYAFKNCSGIKELTLPTKLVHIGESAFYGCTGLSQIELPNSLASTGTYVFKNCTGLESAKLSSGMSRVSESLFYGCTKLTNVTIPEGIKTIDGYAFKNCTNLAGAKLPSTLTKLGESAFYGCTKLTDIVIPDGVANIGSYSFKACTGLSSVTLPANLKRIDESAFYGCTALRNIEIPEGTTDIDSYVFKNCTALTNVKLPQSLVQIGESAFYASKLNEVTIPDSVTTIGSYAFKNCASLAEVTLPANLSKIQESAFYGCEKLTTLEIPDKVKSIEGYAFRKCTALQSVQFPAALRQIGESAFYGCTALKQIALPEGVTSIDGYAFKSCTSLKTISLPSTLEKFGDSAFYGCTTVPEIQIPANVREIGGYAFSRCSGLKVVEFVGDAPTIGAAAFSAVTADAYYPDGNTTWTEDKQQDYGGQLTWHSSVDKLHVVAAANALPAA